MIRTLPRTPPPKVHTGAFGPPQAGWNPGAIRGGFGGAFRSGFSGGFGVVNRRLLGCLAFGVDPECSGVRRGLGCA